MSEIIFKVPLLLTNNFVGLSAGFPSGSRVKNPTAMQELQETQVGSLDGGDFYFSLKRNREFTEKTRNWSVSSIANLQEVEWCR